jgi:hypothetical protein
LSYPAEPQWNQRMALASRTLAMNAFSAPSMNRSGLAQATSTSAGCLPARRRPSRSKMMASIFSLNEFSRRSSLRSAGSYNNMPILRSVRGAYARDCFAAARAIAALRCSGLGLDRSVKPPFTCRFCPVMKHSSLASHTAAAAISSDVPRRPRG